MKLAGNRPRIGVVGVTGLVGRTVLQVLAERHFPMANVRGFSSAATAGKVHVNGDLPDGTSWNIASEALTEEAFDTLDIAIFSAGGSVSRQWAPIAAQRGCIVIDNSSAWRMHPQVPLVVPEVNAKALEQHRGIIANPNCSTIQLVCVLQPIMQRFPLTGVVVSTYQSVSGAGEKGVQALQHELQGTTFEQSPFRYPVAYNTIFHELNPASLFTEEEEKMKRETVRILDAHFPLAVTCVRVPTIGGHGESVFLQSSLPMPAEEIRSLLAKANGVVVVDNAAEQLYPTPIQAQHKNEVFVGRIRNEDSFANALSLWIVADNIRKGAATNAVQIAEYIINNNHTTFSTPDSWT